MHFERRNRQKMSPYKTEKKKYLKTLAILNTLRGKHALEAQKYKVTWKTF